jgi:hypothetical protein
MYSTGTVNAKIAEKDATDWRLTIGSKFGVTNDGSLYCNNGTFSGIIHAKAGGTIGGWDIGTNSLTNGTPGGDNSICLYTSWSGNENWRLLIGSRFKVNRDGVLTCTNGNFSGKITATSGTIGGWNITDGNGLWRGGSDASSATHYMGPGRTFKINGADKSNIVLKAGPKFGVDSDGNIYCTAGYIGGAKVDGTSIGASKTSNGSVKSWSIKDDGTASFNSIKLTGGTIGGITINNGSISAGTSGSANYWSISSSGTATFSNVSIGGGSLSVANKLKINTSNPGAAANGLVYVYGNGSGGTKWYKGIDSTVRITQTVYALGFNSWTNLYFVHGICVGIG